MNNKNENTMPEMLEDFGFTMGDDATLQLPDPYLLSYYKFAKERIYFINQEIDENLMLMVQEIIKCNIEDVGKPIEERAPIVFCIQSYGGLIDITYTFVDACAASKTPIYTVNMGVSMSAGLLLLLAGHKRFSFKHSQAMIHSGSAGFQGTFEQVEEGQKSYKKQVEQMREYILSRTNIDPKLFSRNKSKDWYISVEDQLKFGIIDKVIDNLDEVF